MNVILKCADGRGGAVMGWADSMVDAQLLAESFEERYSAFLKNKAVSPLMSGFEISADDIQPLISDNPLVKWKPHQIDVIRWAVRGGRRALFERFGLGKTLQQLEILRLIVAKEGGRGLVVCPLGVRREFIDSAKMLGITCRFVRSLEECDSTGIYVTNYETVRDGKLDPSAFTATSLDEAAILRGFGGTKTFREFMRLFEGVRYRFVATATPDPNEYIELLAYAAYLGVMDVGEGKTRFFKRDATKADVLTLHPHKEEEWWMFVATWAIFLERPSDLGHSDDGYDLPPLVVRYHEVKIDADCATVSDRNGQQYLIRNAALGVTEAAREKRDSLAARVEVARRIVMDESPDDHFILWHDQEAERYALERAIPEIRTAYGNQDLEEREEIIRGFSDGEFRLLGTKPVLSGSGCNFQRHCHKAIFVGIGFKFAEFFQAIHRIHRFLQGRPVEIHLIYSENERQVLKRLLDKWERHKEKVNKMSEIIRSYGLNDVALGQALVKSLGVDRIEAMGKNYRIINNDSVLETHSMPDNSVGLILTSIPFSTQYEYTPSYNDFGHSEDNDHFFRQMDFLTPQLMRVLQPGRIAAIHVKDRVVPGGINGCGVQSVYPFHCDTIRHFMSHGFLFMGMKTITTDVVRENNQTYRLGWTEQCKDGTKMGYGLPEYLLLFRKPQTDRTKGYADIPVRKNKTRYSKGRWQVDAHGFTRSDGNRMMLPEEVCSLPHQKLFGMFHDWYLEHVYNFEHHVSMADGMEARGRLPVTFMLFQPPSVHPDVWTDITRMLTVNALQAQKGKAKHLCPLQLDIADRVISQMSNPGDVVYDPFGGLMTVPMRAVALGRQGWGVELNPGYWLDGCAYVKAAAEKLTAPTLFDLIAAEDEYGSD